jgi:hypothetical protein
MRTITTTTGIAAIAASAGVASAAVFDDRANFETAASNANVPLDGFESFENFTADESNFLDLVDADGFEVTGEDSLDGFPFIFTIENNLTSGLVPTDGDQVLRSSTFDGAIITFTFDQPVLAAGFDIIGAGNFGGPGEITLANNLGESTTVFSGSNNNTNETFFAGIVSDAPFQTLTLTNTFDGDSFGIDAVSFGIPSPGAAGLLGVAGLAATRRRR